MNSGILLTALAGVIGTFASGFFSWLFTRRKYNSEVDGKQIANMIDSLEFYTKLSESNKKELDALRDSNEELIEQNQELLKQNTKLLQEILRLQSQVNSLIGALEKAGIEYEHPEVEHNLATV